MSAGKVLACVFWDAAGILFIDYLKKGRTIISEYYMTLLVRLKEEIAKKKPQMKNKKSSKKFDRCALRSVLPGPRASHSVLCSSHTFKFISYNLILKLKPI